MSYQVTSLLAFAGLMGAVLMMLLWCLFTRRSPNSRIMLSSALAGVIGGWLFGYFTEKQTVLGFEFLAVILAYASWQIPVGVALLDYASRVQAKKDNYDFESRFRDFLAGPVVQLVGLIGTILGILSYIKNG